MSTAFPPIIAIAEVAQPAWRRLSEALEDHAPPCSTDPELWFSSGADGVEAASHRCLTCPALTECGEYADLAGETHGVWASVDRSRPALGKRSAA